MISRILRQAAVGIAALGLLAPPTLLSAAEPPATISDVALGANGTLHGQVVNAAGAVASGVEITIRQNDNVLARTTSSPAGKFEIVGLPGGLFQISTDHSEVSLRPLGGRNCPASAPARRYSSCTIRPPCAASLRSADCSRALWCSPLSWRPQWPFRSSSTKSTSIVNREAEPGSRFPAATGNLSV